MITDIYSGIRNTMGLKGKDSHMCRLNYQQTIRADIEANIFLSYSVHMFIEYKGTIGRKVLYMDQQNSLLNSLMDTNILL